MPSTLFQIVITPSMEQLQIRHDDAVAGLDYISSLVWKLSERDESRPVTQKEAELISVYLQQAKNTLNDWYKTLKKNK